MGLGFQAWCSTSMEQLRLKYQCISVSSWRCSAILRKGCVDLRSVRNRGNVKNTNPRWQWPGMCGLSHTHATLPPVIILHHCSVQDFTLLKNMVLNDSVSANMLMPTHLSPWGVQLGDNVPSSLPNTLPEQTLKPGLASGVNVGGFSHTFHHSSWFRIERFIWLKSHTIRSSSTCPSRTTPLPTSFTG